MASKELIEKVARAMLDAERKSMDLPHRVFHTPADRESVATMAEAAISTILDALQEPTEGMLKAGWGGLGDEVWNPTTLELSLSFKAMLNASPLGEQSE